MNGIVLTTTDTLEIWLASAPAATQPTFVVTYLDDAHGTYGNAPGVCTGTAHVTAVASPASGRLIITNIHVYNGDTNACRVYVGINASGTVRTCVTRVLQTISSDDLSRPPAYTPNGDMTKAEYDENNDGLIDSAATAAQGAKADTALQAANNLSDVADAAMARTNIGAGTSSLTLGEAETSAYRGDRGKIAYNHSQMTSGNPHGVTKAQVGLGNCDNTSDVNKPVSTAQATAISNEATARSANDTAQTFSNTTVLTNPYTGSTLTPRFVGDFSVNTATGEIWVGVSTTSAAASWERGVQGIYGGTIVTDAHAMTISGFYSALSTASNIPTSAENFLLIYVSSNTGTTSGYLTAVGLTTGKIYSQIKASSAWSSWSTGVTATEIGYLSGLTSSLVTLLASKADLPSVVSWTPVLHFGTTEPTGLTYSSQVGAAYISGSRMELHCSLTVSNIGTGGSGYAYIGGLPYSVSNSMVRASGLVFCNSLSSSTYQAKVCAVSNSNMSPYIMLNTTDHSNILTYSTLSSGSSFQFTIILDK